MGLLNLVFICGIVAVTVQGAALPDPGPDPGPDPAPIPVPDPVPDPQRGSFSNSDSGSVTHTLNTPFGFSLTSTQNYASANAANIRGGRGGRRRGWRRRFGGRPFGPGGFGGPPGPFFGGYPGPFF